MKIRRVRTLPHSTPTVQFLSEGGWTELTECPAFLSQRFEPPASAVSDLVMPVQPLSFRDFMVYEQHVINASRGYAKRFLPGVYKVASVYEFLTKKNFPGFKPKPLWSQEPIYYFGNHMTFVPSGTPVPAPAYTTALDYELELGFVLAHPLHNATAEEAVAAIGGFVVLNDISARDVQRSEMTSGFGPQKSKHFMSSMSETLVTADEILPLLDALVARVFINEKEILTTSSKDMKYSVGEMLAHASKSEKLYPGELFGTGTLPGGCALENGHWVKPGDHLRLQIDQIGSVEHIFL